MNDVIGATRGTTETTTRVIGLVRQISPDTDPASIGPETRLVEDLAADSINRLMLITLIEQEFAISLDKHMATLVGLSTVGEVIALIDDVQGH